MIEIQNLSFRYPGNGFELAIDRLLVETGEKVAVLGPSGCGKTTLLNLVAGIERPRTGEIHVLNTEVQSLSESQRRDFRIRNCGMVFQEFELVEYLTSMDNILLPFSINRSFQNRNQAESRAVRLAEIAGIDDKLRRHPGQLSRGEQQRVAICRALIAEPKVILADEPTGNLDPATKQVILDLLFEQCEQRGLTMLVVTHDHNMIHRFDRTIDFERLRFSVAAEAEA